MFLCVSIWRIHLKLKSRFSDSVVVYRYVCARAEIEMVVMEKCKVSELTEQNITDEEKTAAATRTHAQRSR